MIRTSWLWLIINFFDHFAIYIHETLSEFYIRNTIFRLDMNSPLVPLRSICINRRTTSVSCTGSLDLVTWINLLFIHKCVYSGVWSSEKMLQEWHHCLCNLVRGDTGSNTGYSAQSGQWKRTRGVERKSSSVWNTFKSESLFIFLIIIWSSPTGNMFRKSIISLLTLAKPERVVDSQD